MVEDHVITPTFGLRWMVAEDAVDRYLFRHFERWAPWHRDTRPGIRE
jgi:hypothetical protein